MTGLQAGSGAGEFPTTAWSLVVSAGKGSAEALEKLCRRYRDVVHGLFTWYVRTRGLPTVDPEDLTQEFLLYLVMHREAVLGRACPEKGRFRAWLRTCLRNWLNTWADSARAFKRGGGATHLSLDRVPDEVREGLCASDDLDREFNRRWASDLMKRSLARLKGEERDGGLERGDLRVFELKHGEDGLSAREVAVKLKKTANLVVVALRRVTRRLRAILQEEAAMTTLEGEDFEREMKELLDAMGG